LAASTSSAAMPLRRRPEATHTTSTPTPHVTAPGRRGGPGASIAAASVVAEVAAGTVAGLVLELGAVTCAGVLVAFVLVGAVALMIEVLLRLLSVCAIGKLCKAIVNVQVQG